MEYNPEMMLLACRCLCNMIEALPGSAAVVIENGAAPILTAKMLNIEYIDLAEQALTALDSLPVSPPRSPASPLAFKPTRPPCVSSPALCSFA